MYFLFSFTNIKKMILLQIFFFFVVVIIFSSNFISLNWQKSKSTLLYFFIFFNRSNFQKLKFISEILWPNQRNQKHIQIPSSKSHRRSVENAEEMRFQREMEKFITTALLDKDKLCWRRDHRRSHDLAFPPWMAHIS